ncbi:MAG: TlpA family protein disulfide reductase [Flavobacteriaceae bacterium]|nr:TlpA family protein disulfide reductase [Flavobacteriaceae bacterium]
MPKISLFKILKIKRIAVYAYITLIGFMTSCTQNTDIESVREVQLSLNTDLLQEDDAVLYLLRQNYLEQPELIDSLNTTSNKSISLSVNPQDLFLLQAKDQQLQTLLFLDAAEVRVNYQNNTLEVQGGEQNGYLNDYLEKTKYFQSQLRTIQREFEQNTATQDSQQIMQIRQKYQEIQNQNISYIREFASTMNESILAVWFLFDLQQQRLISSEEFTDWLDLKSKKVKQSGIAGKAFELSEKLTKSKIGSTVENFKGPQPDGTEIELYDHLGKITLIDFWAAWCKPCRLENPNIVSVYQDYRDKGFTVVGVSLDTSKSRWTQAIADDQLDWAQISHLQRFRGPIARSFNITAIPSSFLVDENGVIIAKNLRGYQLRQKISELLD